MEFPTFVYRCPGPHFGPLGTTYQTLDVASQSALDEALSEGWHVTLLGAAESFVGAPASASKPVEPVVDDAPPTRHEMLEQAKKIGLKVDRRWSDETLLDAIVARMKEQRK